MMGMAIGALAGRGRLGQGPKGLIPKMPRGKKARKAYFGKGDGKPFSKSPAAKAGWRRK